MIGTAAKDFNVQFEVIGDVLRAVISGHSSIIDGVNSERMLLKMDDLIKRLASSEDSKSLSLQTLNQLSSPDFNAVTLNGRSTISSLPSNDLFYTSFEHHAKQLRDKVAVWSEGTSLTYRDLEKRCNALARNLRKIGIVRGSAVGFVASRSLEMIVGMLAIMKCGAAYVPLDSSFPKDRIATMVKEACCAAILYMSATEDVYKSLEVNLKSICVTDFVKLPLANLGAVNKLPDVATGDDTAFIVFTSGTTGKPKGVMVTHHGVTRLLDEPLVRDSIPPEYTNAQFMSIGFDAAQFEIFLALSLGTTLYLRGEIISDIISKTNVLHITPTGLAAIDPEMYPNLKVIFVGGEAIQRPLAEKWSSRVKLINVYGPTEASLVQLGMQIALSTEVTAGRPLANSLIYVVDENMELIPPGVIGEVVIGGLCVAKGYVNSPDGNTTKFLPNPFAEGRVYKTGDLGCWLPNGQMKILGRADTQVKLRGYRVELDEVENVITTIPSVKLAAAIVRGGILFAYISPAAATKNDLRKMEESELDFNESENCLADIWRALLRTDQLIGRKTSFFELGGDSMSLIRMTMAAKSAGFTFTVATVFKTPFLGSLAAWFGNGSIEVEEPRCALAPGDIVEECCLLLKSSKANIEDVYPATALQSGMLVETMKDPSMYVINQCWDMDCILSKEEIVTAWKKLLSAHTILRTRFASTSRGIYQVVLRDCESFVEFQTAPSEAVEEIHSAFIVNDLAKGFNLNEECLRRLTAIRVEGTARVRLILTIHHGIYDGHSMKIVFNDLMSALSGKPVIRSPDYRLMVGPLLNTVPFRVQLSNSMTFTDLVKTAHAMYAATLPFNHAGLVDIKKGTNLRTHDQLFNSLFVFQSYLDLDVDEDTTAIGVEDRGGDGTTWDQWGIEFSTGLDGINARMSFDRASFSIEVINGMFHKIDDIFTKLETPGNLSRSLDFFGALSELDMTLVVKNGNPLTKVSGLRTCELYYSRFEELASKSPNAIAIVDDDKTITYGELNKRANAIANKLREQFGVFNGQHVGLIVTRSIEFVVGNLGILKSGAAYVVLNASFPVERLCTMIEEANCGVVLHMDGTENILAAVNAHFGFRRNSFNLSEFVGDQFMASKHKVDKLKDSATKSDTAFVIFTSGSTGKPKGVMVPHCGITRWLDEPFFAKHHKTGDRISQFMSIGFDAAQSEIFLSLSTLSTLYLIGSDPPKTIKLVTVLQTTPTGLSALNPDDYPNLRVVYLGGEHVPKALADRWAARCILMNEYGPSEASDKALGGQILANTTITVGNTLVGAKIYLMDEKLDLVPPGVVGEIFIGGFCVSNGYINRPEQNIAKFLRDPFGVKGDKMYRTGDIGRWLPNGQLQIIGRLDSQVKLRGFRLELDEIANVICSHPQIQLATAVVKNNILIAYVSPDVASKEELRDVVAKHLPYYMVPAVFIGMDVMPKNANGKIDRNYLNKLALPALEVSELDLNDDEKSLAEIWRSLLKTDQPIGRNSTFFELGGDSMTLIRMTVAAEAANFGFTVANVFKTPDLSTLASYARKSLHSIAELDRQLVPEEIAQKCYAAMKITTDFVEDIYPATALQFGMLFDTMKDSSMYVVNQSWDLDCSLSDTTILKAWKRFVHAHSILRTRIVGPLLNTVPFRIQLKSTMTFADLVKATHAVYAASLPFNHAGLVDIKKWSRLSSNDQLFNSVFLFQSFLNSDVDIATSGLDAKDCEGEGKTWDQWSIELSTDDDGLNAAISFDKACFSSEVVVEMFRKIDDIITKVSALNGVSEPLQFYGALSPQDTKLISTNGKFPSTFTEVRGCELFYSKFEELALLYPDTIAVVDADKTITYGDLDKRANAIANKLHDQFGISHGHNVGLIVTRSIEFIAGLLGILKTGAAYVVLNSSFPIDRLSTMIEEARCHVVLHMNGTEAVMSSVFAKLDAQLGSFNLTSFTSDTFVTSKYKVSKLADTATGRSTAFVVFTSGSTGKPKGVMVPHCGMTRHLYEPLFTNYVKSGDKFAQFMSIGFDAAQTEIFLSLSTMSTLYLFGPDPLETFKLVTVLQITPTGLSALLPEEHPDLRVVYVGGEQLPKALAERWAASHAVLINLYGPTECSDNALGCQIFANMEVTVGKPITGSTIYVLDQNLDLVPPGVIGEVVIGGPCVTNGYINSPEGNATKFLDDPFDGSKMYRTGDLGRWLPNGHIQMLGRRDNQVKLRGYRLELDEIANAICSHPMVKLAAAIVKDNVLVAYVSPDVPAKDELREAVAKHLPYYMIPAIFVGMEDMPRNSNGKIDRVYLSALPVHSVGASDLELNSIEMKLAELWRLLLKTDQPIGWNSSYFELGGDSLSVMRMIAMANESGLVFKTTDVFKTPTLRALCSIGGGSISPQASAQIKAADSNGRNPIVRKDAKYRVLCLHGYGTSADILKGQLAKVVESMPEVDFVFMDAPFITKDSDVKHIFDGPYHMWWSSARDANRAKMIQFSASKVLAVIDEIGGVDGMIAFSQGAELAQYLSCSGPRSPSWRFIVLMSCCNTISKYSGYRKSLVRSLHVVGSDFEEGKSTVNRKQFYENRILRHNAGHEIPRTDLFCGLLVSELKALLVSYQL
ncbi:hypothetical protein HK101_011849, partial [Irineochytrium annulatum]